MGFKSEDLPDCLARYRGRDHRAIPASGAFPYEDAQFEVAMIDSEAVSHETVREAHRILKPDGRLYFIVPEKTRKQAGFTLPQVYSLVRDGFNITELERTPWWHFRARVRTLFITARKKAWKAYHGLDCRNLATHALFAGADRR